MAKHLAPKRRVFKPFKKISAKNKRLLTMHRARHVKNKSFKTTMQLNKHMFFMRQAMMKGMTNFKKAHDWANRNQGFKATKKLKDIKY